MYHSFCSEIATRYGVLEAILLNYLYFWTETNRANGTNFRDGTYWTYNTLNALGELFPYASTKRIRSALKKLEGEGCIKTGNFNTMAWDRTTWYALTDLGLSIVQKGKMEDAERENDNFPKGKMEPIETASPIPFNNTVNNTDNNADIYTVGETPKSHKNFVPPTVEEVRAYITEKHYNIDAEYFVDYYAARGWLVGGKTKIRDWKAAVRTWVRNEHDRQSSSGFTRSGSKTQTRPLTDTDRANIQATRELFAMTEGDADDE